MKQDESSGLVWISLLLVARRFGARPFIHLEYVQLIGKAPAMRCSSPPALCWNKISLHNWLHYLLMLWNHPQAFLLWWLLYSPPVPPLPSPPSPSFYESNFCLLLFPWKLQDCGAVSGPGPLWHRFSLQAKSRKLILLAGEEKELDTYFLVLMGRSLLLVAPFFPPKKESYDKNLCFCTISGDIKTEIGRLMQKSHRKFLLFYLLPLPPFRAS